MTSPMRIRISENEWRSILDIPSSTPPSEVANFFNKAKRFFCLEQVTLHYISIEALQKTQVREVLVQIGQMGQAFPERDLICTFQSDLGVEEEKRVIVHELLHIIGLDEVEARRWTEPCFLRIKLLWEIAGL